VLGNQFRAVQTLNLAETLYALSLCNCQHNRYVNRVKYFVLYIFTGDNFISYVSSTIYYNIIYYNAQHLNDLAKFIANSYEKYFL